MSQQYFNSYDDAQDALPRIEDAGQEHLEHAARAERQRQESWERSDTDGFLSQWASQQTSIEQRMKADLAKQGGMDVFPALVDIETGEIVARKLWTFPNKFSYNEYRYVWMVERNGDDVEWVTDYKRDSSFEKKGLRKVWVIAPAFIGAPEQDPLRRIEPRRGMPTGPIGYRSIQIHERKESKKAA